MRTNGSGAEGIVDADTLKALALGETDALRECLEVVVQWLWHKTRDYLNDQDREDVAADAVGRRYCGPQLPG
jgi:hypothetical protein